MAVIQAFADDDIEQGQVEGQVGAGSDGQPFGRLGGRLGEARVEVTTLTPRSMAWLRAEVSEVEMASIRLRPVKMMYLSLLVIPVGFFHAVGHQVGDDHGVEAQAALRAVIGRAEGVEQVLEQRLAQVVRGRKDHRLRAVLLS